VDLDVGAVSRRSWDMCEPIGRWVKLACKRAPTGRGKNCKILPKKTVMFPHLSPLLCTMHFIPKTDAAWFCRKMVSYHNTTRHHNPKKP
jgi:hypothetical protein